MNAAVWFIPSSEPEPGALQRLGILACALGLKLRISEPWTKEGALKALYVARRRAPSVAALVLPLDLLWALDDAVLERLRELRAQATDLRVLAYAVEGQVEPPFMPALFDEGLITRLVYPAVKLKPGRWRIGVPPGLSSELACLGLLALPRISGLPHLIGEKGVYSGLARKLAHLLLVLGWRATNTTKARGRKTRLVLSPVPVEPEKGFWLPVVEDNFNFDSLLGLVAGLARANPAAEELAAVAQLMVEQRAMAGLPFQEKEPVRLASGLQVRFQRRAGAEPLWTLEGAGEESADGHTHA
jgi:hypothetical protein